MNVPAVGSTLVGVQSELLSMRHSLLVAVVMRRVLRRVGDLYGCLLSLRMPWVSFIPFQDLPEILLT